MVVMYNSTQQGFARSARWNELRRSPSPSGQLARETLTNSDWTLDPDVRAHCLQSRKSLLLSSLIAGWVWRKKEDCQIWEAGGRLLKAKRPLEPGTYTLSLLRSAARRAINLLDVKHVPHVLVAEGLHTGTAADPLPREDPLAGTDGKNQRRQSWQQTGSTTVTRRRSAYTCSTCYLVPIITSCCGAKH